MLSTKTVHCSVPWKSSTIKKPPRSRYSRSFAACASLEPRDVPVAARIVDRPARAAALPHAAAPADRRVHEAREDPLGRLPEVRRQLEVVVFDAGILAPLHGVGDGDAHQAQGYDQR